MLFFLFIIVMVVRGQGDIDDNGGGDIWDPSSTDECDFGYYGNECDITYTCYGLDSFNTNVCSGNGMCVGTDTCNCNAPFGGEECEIDTRHPGRWKRADVYKIG